MAFDKDLPAADDTLAESDDYIRANWAQLEANITNQHVWSDDTAANVIHNRASGVITRVMTANDGAVDTAISVPHAFNPTLVLFDWSFVDSAGLITVGSGVSDGTNHACHYAYGNAGTATGGNNASFCIVIYDNTTGEGQKATCAMATNKFTLTWDEIATGAAGTAYIRWTAFG
jgi:hypothetical protein